MIEVILTIRDKSEKFFIDKLPATILDPLPLKIEIKEAVTYEGLIIPNVSFTLSQIYEASQYILRETSTQPLQNRATDLQQGIMLTFQRALMEKLLENKEEKR